MNKWIWDFSRCRVLKENEWPANIRCPKCWFHGESRTIEWDYKPVLFWIFFFCFPVVWGLVYDYLTPKNSYICPNCWNDYVERIQ